MEQPDFSIEQAVQVQRRLRAALGLGEERFPLPAFVGMISDEIEQMRQAGRPDEDVLAVVEQVTGVRIGADELRRFYAPPEERRPPG